MWTLDYLLDLGYGVVIKGMNLYWQNALYYLHGFVVSHTHGFMYSLFQLRENLQTGTIAHNEGVVLSIILW